MILLNWLISSKWQLMVSDQSLPKVDPCVPQVPLFVGNAFLVFRQALCTAANVTTNELLTRGKYSYMRRDDAFWNSFDRYNPFLAFSFSCQATL